MKMRKWTNSLLRIHVDVMEGPRTFIISWSLLVVHDSHDLFEWCPLFPEYGGEVDMCSVIGIKSASSTDIGTVDVRIRYELRSRQEPVKSH